jgi:hypothetical protein
MKILDAIKKRYYDINTLKLEMYVNDNADSVIMNLMEDLNDEYSEEEILNFINNIQNGN